MTLTTRWITAEQPSRQDMLANYMNAKGVKQLYRLLLVDGFKILKIIDRGNVYEMWVGTNKSEKMTTVSLIKSTAVQVLEGSIEA